MTAIDMDAFMAAIQQPGPVDDHGPDHDPDPPWWSDAEADRAADRYEAWLETIEGT